LVSENPLAAQVEIDISEGRYPGVHPDSGVVPLSPSITDRDKIVHALKMKLKNLKGINSVWFEGLEKELYVYVDASDTGKATLHPIFDAQYDIEEEYPDFSFHFRVDSQELESKRAKKRLIKII
jgi:hypothetical protein